MFESVSDLGRPDNNLNLRRLGSRASLPSYAIGVAGPTSRLKEDFEAYLSAIKDSEKAIRQIDSG